MASFIPARHIDVSIEMIRDSISDLIAELDWSPALAADAQRLLARANLLLDHPNAVTAKEIRFLTRAVVDFAYTVKDSAALHTHVVAPNSMALSIAA